MTDKEIEYGIEMACNCANSNPSPGWIVNPYPIIRDYIQRLKAENVALHTRLDKAVELPCKVGNTIYEVGGQYTKDIVSWKIREIILDHSGAGFICNDAESGYEHRYIYVRYDEMSKFWNGRFCLTYAAAENRLSHLGGNQQNESRD